MKIIRNINNIPISYQDSVLVLGNFDGIHLGHQELLKKTIEIAKSKSKKTSLMSFEPHPLEVLKKKTNIRINSLTEKIKLINEFGIDFLFLIRFNRKFFELSANEFLNKILIEKLKINHLVIGHDFIFGKNRSGNATYLKEQSQILNYGFSQILPHKCPKYNIIYSSTEIRNNLKSANLKIVKTLLGRNYNISARVISGNQTGTKIGYKTANIRSKNLLKIKYGVYAVKLHYDKNIYNGIANFGIRPTIKNSPELLEIHIFNFNKKIYGKKVNVEFIDFIREEQKFNNLNQLTEQIAKDCKKAKNILAG